MPPTEKTTSPGISRREAIRRAALAAGVMLSAEWLSIVDGAQAAPRRRRASRAAQASLAGAIADRILPRTDTPGAADVGVPAFIDLLYGDFMTPAEQKMLTDGLDAVEAAAKSAHGASFASLTPRPSGRAAAEHRQGRGGPRAGLLPADPVGHRSSAISRPSRLAGTCCTTIPVPGSYDGCVPIDQVGRRNWTT